MLAVAFLPGFALATLLAPSWRAWQRLAMAPGLSAGLIGVYGLVLHDIQVPFEAITVLPVLVVVGIAAIARWRRSEPKPGVAHPWWLPIPALAVGLVGAGIFAWALHGQVLPPDWDTATHGSVVNAIVRTHDVLPLFPIPLDGSDFLRARPGFEATSAVVSWLGAPYPAAAMGPIITATLVVLPLALTFLTLEGTGSVALAAIVPFFALGLIFPSGQAIIGRFPEIVDATLIVPFIVAALRVVRAQYTRENAVLLFAVTASMWVIHGLEVITAIVVASGLFAVCVIFAVRTSRRAGLTRVGIALVAALAGAVLVTALTRIPYIPSATTYQAPLYMVPYVHMPLKPHHIVVLIAETDIIGPVALALYCIGAVAMLIRRRMLWVLGAQVLLLLMMADDLYTHYLYHLWNGIYPWGDTDRILGVQYWLIPLVLAFGLFALWDLVRVLSRRRQLLVGLVVAAVVLGVLAFALRHPLGHLWTSFWQPNSVVTYPLGVFNQLVNLRQWGIPVAIAAILVLAALVAALRRMDIPETLRSRIGSAAQHLDVAGVALGGIALLAVVVGAASDHGIYNNEVATRSLVSPADLTVLASLQHQLPSGALVLTNGGNDAGMWMAALTDLNPLVPNGYSGGALDIPYEVALENACNSPEVAENAVARVSAVFIGSLHIASPADLWNVDCLEKLSNLRLIASAPDDGTISAAFLVVK